MLELEPDIEAEYQRIIRDVDRPDESIGENSLTVGEVLRAHFQIANRFYLEGEGLGGIGPKDIGLLHSAVHRQNVSYGGKSKWTNPFEVCATLFYGIVKNHAFHDANKRTAFLCALYQLRKKEWCPSVSEKEFEDFTVDVANNDLRKYNRFEEMLKKGDEDPEVRFISWYFRRNVRKIERADYVITYRELDKILRRYSYCLGNPSGNYIDVLKIEEKKPFIGIFGKTKTVETKVCQIGFPRWTAEVSKSALKSVREATRLTPQQGVDSASFFQGLDPMQTLITSYHEPLMRLAHR